MNAEKLKIQELQQIEIEFDIIIQKDRRNWLRVAKLLDKIEQKELYQVKARSFTVYVKDLAKRSGINVSTLWRARSGARIYMEMNKIPSIDNIEDNSVNTTPEQLEMYSKVRTIAPEDIVQEVKEKMLKGEGMRHELKELWKIYRPLKGGKTERGRKSRDYFQEERDITPIKQFSVPYSLSETNLNQSIKEDSYVQLARDMKKMERFQLSSEDLAEANIINALRTRRWVSLTLDQYEINRYTSFANFPLDEQEDRKKIDLLALVRKDKEDKGKQPLIFGVSDIAYLDKVEDPALLLYLAQYCNYYYVAVPMIEQHIRKALKVYPKEIGIIVVGDKLEEDTKHELKIVRKSPFRDIEPKKHLELYGKMIVKALDWD